MHSIQSKWKGTNINYLFKEGPLKVAISKNTVW